jgi:hypothetical protein
VGARGGRGRVRALTRRRAPTGALSSSAPLTDLAAEPGGPQW